MQRSSRRRRRRRRVHWGRLILLLILVLAIIALLVFGVLLLTGKLGDKDKDKPNDLLNEKPGIQSTTDDPMDLIGDEQTTEVVPEPTPTPIPQLSENLTLSPIADTDPDNFGIKTGLMVSGEEASSYQRPEAIRFGKGEDYTELSGIITFAGSNYRNSFTYGTQTLVEKELEKVWYKEISSLGGWSGTGWTGMPIIIQWPEETRQHLGIYDEFKDMDGFTEVIYPTMDGNIYFMELHSGKATRDKIHLGVTTKGTASLDPRGYPMLYTGQGIPEDGKAYFRAINLITNEIDWEFGGRDPFSHRSWQAWDSSALIHADTDTLITGGENGVLYTIKLNSKYDPAAGTMSIDPDNVVKYRYTGDGYGHSDQSDKRWPGIENSIAIFRNYAYFTDNGGRLSCVDLNTMELQFVVDVLDDSDTSIVIEEDVENDTFYLYTANEVDKQSGISGGLGNCYHRKINGLTGEIIWQESWKADIGNTSSNGGTLTTPHVGRGNISDIVIYSSTLVPVTFTNSEGREVSQNGGRLVAYNKHNGEVLWTFEQAAGYWASPVVIYDENDDAYLIQCDRSGMLRLHDPRTGEVLFEMDMGSRIESTPAVFENMLVVGTRGTHGSGESPRILGVKIK